MTPEEIEREIQARVEFKMGEFKTSLANKVGHLYSSYYFNPTQESIREWKVYQEILRMVDKEIQMAVPFDEMAERNQREARNKAVNEIEMLLNPKGTRGLLDKVRRDWGSKVGLIASIIEKAQNY